MPVRRIIRNSKSMRERFEQPGVVSMPSNPYTREPSNEARSQPSRDVNFGGLVQAGILEHRPGGWWGVLRPDGLPEHVEAQVIERRDGDDGLPEVRFYRVVRELRAR